jgi:hypothetical protein
MVKDFNFRVRKSLTVTILDNGMYPAMNDTANPLPFKF